VFSATVLPLTDLHQHTSYSPCGIDVSMKKNIEVAAAKGLRVIAFTDHGSVSEPKWINKYFEELSSLKTDNVEVLSGMEVDVDFNGNPVVKREILRKFDVIVAAIHKKPSGVSLDQLYLWWKKTLIAVAEGGFALVIAHPTDIGWFKLTPPLEYCLEVIDVFKENGIAVEINYHHKDPNDYFLSLCLKKGVKLTPTSDAHKLTEIGNLEWHKARVENLGVKIDEVNWLTERELFAYISH